MAQRPTESPSRKLASTISFPSRPVSKSFIEPLGGPNIARSHSEIQRDTPIFLNVGFSLCRVAPLPPAPDASVKRFTIFGWSGRTVEEPFQTLGYVHALAGGYGAT